MNTQVLLLVVVSALLTAAGNLATRQGLVNAGGLFLQGDGVVGLLSRLARQWLFILGVAAYAFGALVWFRVLSVSEVSTSYPVYVGLLFVTIAVAGALLLKESVSPSKVAGIATVLVGIVLIARA